MVKENQDLNWYAWCHELKRDVSANEIWNLFYGENGIMTPLTFACIDENCRARMILKNCQPYMMSTEAQFRLYSKAKHYPACSYKDTQSKIKNRMPILKVSHNFTRMNSYV